MAERDTSRIESELDVKSYLLDLRYALENGAKVQFPLDRTVEENKPIQFTNRYTVADLFPDENPVDALKRELMTLTVENYIKTVKDIRFPKRSEMREFGKIYNGTSEVYIKIRVVLNNENWEHTTFVMSFHYAQKPFSQETFPYRRK